MNKKVQETVSAVIPTRNRPHLVARAVRSALDQTVSPLEVIVVVDGPDEATVGTLDRMEDPRLMTVVLPAARGPAGARNAGVERAQGRWIAFLDDDDEWLPRKLEVQLEAADRSRYASPIITSRFIARTPRGEFVWPRRMPEHSEPLGDYLMVRRGLFLGESWIGTPMLLAKRDLLQRVPFHDGLRVHEDWDWVLRAEASEGTGLEFVPEPLSVCEVQTAKISASKAHDWRPGLDWIRAGRHLVTPRAYAGFIVTILSPAAARSSDWKAFWPLLREMIRHGKPKPIDFLLFAGMWMVPKGTRHWLRSFLTRGPRA